ncbi:MAG: FtsX-like permease family protein [Patescibacteria group bacterium]
MKLIQILYLSYRNLSVHRSRTILTLIGVIIGIGAIMFLVSLGYGLQRLVTDQVVKFDAFSIIDVTSGDSNVVKLTDDTNNKISEITQVDSIGESINLAGKLKIGESATDTVFYAIDNNFAEYDQIKADQGKFISTDASSKDIIVSKAVLNLLGVKDAATILDKDIAADLIVTRDLTENGETKTSANQEFKLVGIIDDESVPFAYIPLQSAKNAGAVNFSMIKVKATDQTEVATIRKTIENMGYKTDNVSDTLAQINQIFSILKVALGILGFIAMIVALLGMFNTLTISLMERTREVGYLKVIGARNRDIFLLFTTESVLIAFVGGVSGVIIGLVFEWLVNIGISTMAVRSGAFPITVFYTPLLFALVMGGFSLLVGIITGIYPARRAVRVKPLDVLRYE